MNRIGGVFMWIDVLLLVVILLLFISCLLFNKVFSGIFADGVYVTDFILEFYTVTLVSNVHQFRSKCSCDELGIVGKSMYHC